MIKQKEHFHGSDLEKIEATYHIKKEDITSFGANVNPLGISFSLRETLASKIDAITSYPDREYTSLRKCISNYTGAALEHIMVGNGSTELISLFIQITHPKKALLLGPTYSEYEREIELEGGQANYLSLHEETGFSLDMEELEAELGKEVDLLIICNPNNPTSSILTRSEMTAILESCKKKGIYVMVDETYVEFAPSPEEVTSIPLVSQYDNLIILRGISKFFAAPGLRLGYATCGNEKLLAEIDRIKNPWTINSLAAIAGEIMFTDHDYIKQTKDLIDSERTRICDRLSACKDLKIYKPNANFVLCKLLRDDITSFDLFETCIKKGLMIRDCSNFPFLDDHYFRFCFMSPEKNDELVNLILETLT